MCGGASREKRVGLLARLAGHFGAGRGSRLRASKRPRITPRTPGNISLQISSPLLRKVAQSEVTTIKSPQIQIKQADQQWHITAESAIITADREYVSLIGDVNMLRLNEISGETLEITTRDVMLRVTPQTASTESFVTIIQYGDRLDALGMNLDMINDNFELLNDVRAHYDIP